MLQRLDTTSYATVTARVNSHAERRRARTARCVDREGDRAVVAKRMSEKQSEVRGDVMLSQVLEHFRCDRQRSVGV